MRDRSSPNSCSPCRKSTAFMPPALAGEVNCGEHVIQMLNKGEKGEMDFQIDLIQAAPGDTIKVVLIGKAHHARLGG